MDMERFVTAEQKAIVKRLIDYALSEAERKYGRGEGDGKTPRSHHNIVHTQDVITAAQQITQLSLEAGQVNGSDVPLVEIAAGFHDIEQDLGSGLNEEESARLAEEKMREAGIFGEEDIQKVKRMISATTVCFEGGIMRQSATEEYLTQILADADLSSLGQEPSVYWERAKGLLREMGKTDTPSREDEIAFTERQLHFLTNHQFYTEEARELFTHKQENISFTRQHLKSLRTEELINLISQKNFGQDL